MLTFKFVKYSRRGVSKVSTLAEVIGSQLPMAQWMTLYFGRYEGGRKEGQREGGRGEEKGNKEVGREMFWWGWGNRKESRKENIIKIYGVHI